MKSRLLYWLLVLLLLAAYIIKNIQALDSDFGWHIRMGQIILKSGIPKTDPLSYTMPSYPFVDHEWLTNVAIAKIYAWSGYTPLAVIFSLLTFIAVLIQIPPDKRTWSLLQIILITTALFGIAGVRTQVISWFLLSLLLLFLRRYSRAHLMHLLFIPLMMLWANLHGSFPIGLVIYGIFIATYIWTEKKIPVRLCLVALAGLGATLINPYTYRIWWEVAMQMTDTKLHWTILEWMPTIFFLNLALWMYVVISLTLVISYRKHLSLFEIILYGFLFLAGMSAYRHMPLWMIASIHINSKIIHIFAQEVSKIEHGARRLRNFYTILIVLALLTSAVEIGTTFYGSRLLAENIKYPKSAIEYLKKNPPKGEIFTLYEWGGYMSWKFPKKKVFIDGRMPSWRWDTPPPGESGYVFEEYQSMVFNKDIKFPTLQKKYNIELVLTQKRKPPTPLNPLEKWLQEMLSTFIKIDPPKTKEAIPFEKMKIIYEDASAILYKV